MPVDQRLCESCNMVEDECHVIMHCSLYDDIRTQLFTEIACFLALLMGLRLHKKCNQGNKYMEMCRTILCINICNLFHEEVRG